MLLTVEKPLGLTKRHLKPHIHNNYTKCHNITYYTPCMVWWPCRNFSDKYTLYYYHQNHKLYPFANCYFLLLLYIVTTFCLCKWIFAQIDPSPIYGHHLLYSNYLYNVHKRILRIYLWFNPVNILFCVKIYEHKRLLYLYTPNKLWLGHNNNLKYS